LSLAARASKRCSTISLPAAVVADANVVLSALIGGRARLVIASPHGPRCVAAEAVAVEIARHIPRLAKQRRLDPALLFAALQVMPVEWRPVADYDERREEAENRIAARDPDDWPTVALALTLGLPVWSQDKDLTAAGLDVFTTGDLLDALRDVPAALRGLVDMQACMPVLVERARHLAMARHLDAEQPSHVDLRSDRQQRVILAKLR
jgi:predicted nucleic acid-binding protein